MDEVTDGTETKVCFVAHINKHNDPGSHPQPKTTIRFLLAIKLPIPRPQSDCDEEPERENYLVATIRARWARR